MIKSETPGPNSWSGDREGCERGSAVHLFGAREDAGRGDGDERRASNGLSDRTSSLRKSRGVVVTSDK